MVILESDYAAVRRPFSRSFSRLVRSRNAVPGVVTPALPKARLLAPMRTWQRPWSIQPKPRSSSTPHRLTSALSRGLCGKRALVRWGGEHEMEINVAPFSQPLHTVGALESYHTWTERNPVRMARPGRVDYVALVVIIQALPV